MRDVLIRFAQRYRQWSERAPFIVNGGTGFLIAAAGDVLCQKYFPHPTTTTAANKDGNDKKNKPSLLPDGLSTSLQLPSWWDPNRSLEMGLIRCFVITPFILFWYPTLLRLSPGTTPLRVLSRVAIDQSIGSPLVVLLVFASNTLLHKETLDDFLQRVRDKSVTTWLKGLQYWPFVHIINFGLLPLAYQPLFAHFASVYWNAVLSYYANFPQETEADSSLLLEDDKKK